MDKLNPQKVFYHLENLLELKNTGDTWPVHMMLGLTSACSHKCIFCYGGHSANKHKTQHIIDLDILLDCLKQAKAHGLKAVTLVGNGEPLLYPRIKELLCELHALDLEIGIFTNGSQLNEEIRVLVLKYCTFIRFSVNASNEKEHEQVHQIKGAFNNIVNNIRELVNLKLHAKQILPTIGTQMVFFEDNYKSIFKAAEMWKKVGVDYFEIKPLVDPPFDLRDKILPAKNKAEIKKQFDLTKNLEDQKFTIYGKYKMYNDTITDSVDRCYKKCLGQALSANLLDDGRLTICAQYEFSPEFSLGNIYEYSFEEIWLSERRKKIISEINVKKCIAGCRNHPINEVLWDYIYPNKENHMNFI